MSRVLNTTTSVGLITTVLLMMGCVGSDATDDSDSGMQVDAESYASANEQNDGNNSSSDQGNAATTTTGDSTEEISNTLDPEIGELLSNLGNGSNDERVAASDALRERRELVLASVSVWF